jgi:hypothetical protein
MLWTTTWALTAFLFFGASADKPYLTEPDLVLDEQRVVLSFDLVGAFTDELFEQIQTGLATGFTYQFNLLRDHLRWADNRIDTSELQVVAMYNAVTREYLINFKQDGKLVDSRIARDREELERAMTRIESIPAFVLGHDLNPDKRYLIKARAKLGSRTIMLLIPTRIETDWVTTRKFRPPATEP